MIQKYGAFWPDSATPMEIERACIRKGGKWISRDTECGAGLFQHYMALEKLLWPWKDWHRWNHLMLEELVNNRGTVFLGPASSAKTHEVSAFILADYFTWPECTTSLVSSTNLKMLELRIWGEIKKLYADAKARFPKLSGHLNDSKQRITTATRSGVAKDFRNGIQGIACNKGGTYVGLSNYAGIKNTRVRVAGDEMQFMPPSFIEAFNNLSKTPRDFKAIGMGNPKDLMDGLGKMAEPETGWETLDRTEKTKTWNCRMPGTRCVQLVGTDSPNYDLPKNRFTYLIKPHQIEEDRKYYGPNSLQFAMMDLGMMPLTGASNRVITEAICRANRAMEPAIFDGKVTKILGLDAAYGRVGGDRCVGIELWFGKSVNGEEIVAQNGLPWIIPVSFKVSDTPENQIVKYLRKECTDRGMSPEHIFYDSTGRGTLGTSFGRLWSTAVNPIEFGGNASERPISAVDRRPCNKAYGKFVTELWYQVRMAIESGQVRGMTMDVVEEGSMREYMMIDEKKVDVEPKPVTKLRMGKSPDLFDGWVCAFEGARRLGFVIASKVISVRTGPTIWDIEAKKTREMYHRRRLTYGTH